MRLLLPVEKVRHIWEEGPSFTKTWRHIPLKVVGTVTGIQCSQTIAACPLPKRSVRIGEVINFVEVESTHLWPNGPRPWKFCLWGPRALRTSAPFNRRSTNGLLMYLYVSDKWRSSVFASPLRYAAPYATYQDVFFSCLVLFFFFKVFFFNVVFRGAHMGTSRY